MRISVVVPTYNRADLLPETLSAILGQSRPPDEVIVVDDGSRDETAAVLAGYAAPVRAIRIANSGDLVARNVGLRAATGDLVAFCDSDDLWRPDFLAAMAELWACEPKLHAAFSDFIHVRGGVWETDRKFDAAPAGYWDAAREIGRDAWVFDASIFVRLVDFQPLFPSCMVVDRRWFAAIGGWDEGASRMVGSDSATALRVGQAPPVAMLRRPLVGIRRHAGNFSGDVQAMNLGDARVLEYVLATRPELAPDTAIIRASIADRRRAALETAFARRDMAAIRDIYPLLAPAERNWKTRIKHLIARLPVAVAGPLAKFLSR
jgi:glycosyltransferase involved in cell wall biosynthesis